MKSASISRSDLTVIHNELTTKAKEIMAAKNHDYAHEGDVFRNFRRYGTFGVLVRLSDKLARLDSFEENKEFKVADEKLIDTVVDIINYAVIYFAMKQETEPLLVEMTFGVNNLISNRPVIDGPYCDFGCGNLADFGDADFVCANCAVEKGMDTTEMTILEPVA